MVQAMEGGLVEVACRPITYLAIFAGYSHDSSCLAKIAVSLKFFYEDFDLLLELTKGLFELLIWIYFLILLTINGTTSLLVSILVLLDFLFPGVASSW